MPFRCGHSHHLYPGPETRIFSWIQKHHGCDKNGFNFFRQGLEPLLGFYCCMCLHWEDSPFLIVLDIVTDTESKILSSHWNKTSGEIITGHLLRSQLSEISLRRSDLLSLPVSQVRK